MRIACIITSLDVGGAEMMLLKLLSRIRSHVQPHVISLTTIGEIGKRLEVLGIPVEALGLKGSLSALRGMHRLSRRLRELEPDIVHTWLYHADLIGGLAARIAHVPAIAWNVRTSSLPRRGGKLSTRAIVHACALLSNWLPDRIVCCSRTAVDIHTSLGYAADKFVVLPNGFDLQRFLPSRDAQVSVRNELGVAPETLLIGLVARFDPQKSHETFIRAASLLHRRRPDVHFLLVGAGVDDQNSEVRTAVDQLGIRGVAHLLGLRMDVPRLTAALDIATLCSSWGEAFPNVVGEAMACGVPCVVTEVGDAAEIVGDTGLAIATEDPEGLALAWERILAMSREERLVLGQRARTRIAERFDLASVAKQYECIYDELVANAPRPVRSRDA